MESNLYDFLRYVQMAGQKAVKGAVPLGKSSNLYIPITEEVRDWLTTYMNNPGVVIEFRARRTGRMLALIKPPPVDILDDVSTAEAVDAVGEEVPEMEHHYALAGAPQEVFELLLESMLLNPTWASIVVAVGRAYAAKVPLCRRCGQRHNGRSAEDCPNIQTPSWEFKTRDH